MLKSFFKKYLPLFSALIFTVLIVNLIINRQYTGFFYYAFLILHTLTILVNIFLFFRPSKSILYGVIGIFYKKNDIEACSCCSRHYCNHNNKSISFKGWISSQIVQYSASAFCICHSFYVCFGFLSIWKNLAYKVCY